MPFVSQETRVFSKLSVECLLGSLSREWIFRVMVVICKQSIYCSSVWKSWWFFWLWILPYSASTVLVVEFPTQVGMKCNHNSWTPCWNIPMDYPAEHPVCISGLRCTTLCRGFSICNYHQPEMNPGHCWHEILLMYYVTEHVIPYSYPHKVFYVGQMMHLIAETWSCIWFSLCCLQCWQRTTSFNTDSHSWM